MKNKSISVDIINILRQIFEVFLFNFFLKDERFWTKINSIHLVVSQSKILSTKYFKSDCIIKKQIVFYQTR